jgi:hypothetical protein
MDDKKILKGIVTGTFSMEELQERILDIFMAEISAEIMKGTPVDSGYMRQHWHERKLNRTQIEFANNTAYLPFHITGTGLYGPKHQMICAKGMSKRNPKHAHVMAWKPKGGSKMMFRRCTRGMRPNSFIEDGIEAGIANGCTGVMEMFSGADNVIE